MQVLIAQLVRPGIRNCLCSTFTKRDQVRQMFNPELDVAKQLVREIFRPQWAERISEEEQTERTEDGKDSVTSVSC